MQELIHKSDICSLFSKSQVLSYKIEKSRLLVLSQEFAYRIQTETFYLSTGLRTLPCRICSKLSAYSIPVLFCQNLLILKGN